MFSQKFVKIFVAFIILATATLACGGQAVEQAVETGLGWQEFTSETGNFSILFPGTPRERVQMLPGGDVETDIYSYIVEVDSTAFAVSHNKVSAVNGAEGIVDHSFDAARDNFVASVSGDLVAEEPITINGHPGRKVTFTIADGTIPGGGYGVVQMCLVEDQLYQVAVLGANGDYSAADAEQFLNSFFLLSDPAVEALAN